jgi:hypothetical protein
MIAQSNQYIAVLDTCVLAPMPLCDALLRLVVKPAFHIPRSSADILRELRTKPQRTGGTPAQADRRITAMGTTFDYAEVVGMDPPRSSAAVRGAHVINAEHVRHFPPEPVERHYLDELTPDDFLVCQHRRWRAH